MKTDEAPGKLDKANAKLSAKRNLKFRYETKDRKAVHKLCFKKTIAYGHKVLYEAEPENVGVEAIHKGELLVEKSSLISRKIQKHKIKREYARTARDAKKGVNAVKKAENKTAQSINKIVRAVKSHPYAVIVILCLAGLLIATVSAISFSVSFFSGSGGTILASCYLAEDEDIDRAELDYTEWETDLQLEFDSAEFTHPGYDEYRCASGEIDHNPFALMAYLTALYADFTYAEVQPDLAGIFASQYNLTYSPEVEIRYRAETRTGSTTYTDPTTGGSRTEYYTYEVEVPYEWHILNVQLSAAPFTDLTYPRLNAEQAEIYNLLMQTKGNRQYLRSAFNFNWLPYVSSCYGYRIHPISGEKNYHKGIDIAVAQGTPVLAGFDGIVSVGNDPDGHGNYITVSDGEGLVAKYAHLSAILVTNGQAVNAGDIIGEVGTTGNSTGPHLHLEVIADGIYLNPIYFAETGDDGGSHTPPGQPNG
jgi:murein DD-endopeptidase MepM/ murein hydrolase activator NlpD